VANLFKIPKKKWGASNPALLGERGPNEDGEPFGLGPLKNRTQSQTQPKKVKPKQREQGGQEQRPATGKHHGRVCVFSKKKKTGNLRRSPPKKKQLEKEMKKTGENN